MVMITDVKKISIGWSLRYKPAEGVFLRDVIIWCRQTIRKNVNQECPLYGTFPWSYELHKTYTFFTFGRESDMLLFILRWS